MEEESAEKRINKILLLIVLFYLILNLFLPLFRMSGYTDIYTLINLAILSVFLLYLVVVYFALKKGIRNTLFKYVTMFITVSVVTTLAISYRISDDYIHSFRTVMISGYFVTIFLSGMYLNYKVTLFTTLIISLEYLLHLSLALVTGSRIYMQTETFRENILTFDIVIFNLSFFIVSGILMYIISKRHQKLILSLSESSIDLVLEQEKANRFENYDPLTSLPNFKLFKEMVQEQIVISEMRYQEFSILCLGIDGFKSINQLYGAESANRLLIMVADRLKETYRRDDFISRFIGDTFLVIFPDLNTRDNISNLINKTRMAFAEAFQLQEHKIKLTCCGGFCSYPYDGNTAELLIDNAETAMVEAKKSGKNQFRYFDIVRQLELEYRIVIENDFEDSIRNKHFYLVYQPKVDQEGRITGMESLIRWNHPKLGQISPGNFIDIAEQSGDIIALGYFVIEECCLQIQKWSEAGISPKRITVNVSPFQFSQSDFPDKVEEIMKRYETDPEWLGIELTESGMMIKEDECISRLVQLRNLGLTISIDDFGTGYSSFSRLGSYPIDILKIDKSFVDGVPEDANSTSIVRSIIDLAMNLNLNLVAEGVENKEQVIYLAANGCPTFQGYFFHKPMLPEHLFPLLKE